MSSCDFCNQVFEGKHFMISCICCNEIFHATEECADPTASEIKVAELKKSLDFNSSALTVKNLANSLVCNLESLNKSFTKDIANLKSELKTIRESCATIDTLCEKIDSAQHDIVNLKSAVDTIPKLQQDIANINAELERSNTAQNWQSSEYNKIRPIVVTFSNNQDPHLVMKNRKKIPGKTIIGSDKTKSQQAHYKEVSASLKTRLDNGEKDLTIRIRNKLHLVRNNIHLFSSAPSIIISTETWLHGGILDSEIGLDNYNIYRRDRHNLSVNVPGGGGGVLIAIHKSLNSHDCQFISDDCEQVYAAITF
ncbi:hypothetical protein QAD02_002205 [Eretmocerus hayati]|uniref:Uncharacterized protein n=1 Tax=Eretmocerus hayati TaxID=131215 RepID=A0ACC2NK07_9HYME|nr:hypothetical protein QAD02_002205 [Eretmocerus hayati]